MKTIQDLNALIPQLIDLVLEEPEIGGDGFGCYSDPKANSVRYAEDGWDIEICYECTGDWDNDPGDYMTPPSSKLRDAWGEVTEIGAYHYDEATDEETEFSESDMKEVRMSLDKALQNI